jgi:integrase
LRDSEIARIKRKDFRYNKELDLYILQVHNPKTDSFNIAGSEYRKFPVHNFIANKIKKYIKMKESLNTFEESEKKIELDDYLFGKAKTNKHTKKVDGQLEARNFSKAIVWLYGKIRSEKILQNEGYIEAISRTKEDTEKDLKIFNETHIEKIVFYSCRHTFQTLLATKYKGQSILIDYFAGHKPQQIMLANYLHINQLDDNTFFNEYGKYLIDFQNDIFSFSQENNETPLDKIDKTEFGTIPLRLSAHISIIL